MPRQPTGNPRGRPKGTGRLTPAQTVDEAQTRVTVRLPTVLYDRLEAFAAGRSYHRGSPQLARCVREALEEYLERHTKKQTENNILVSGVGTPRAEDDNRQTAHGVSAYDATRYVLGKLCPRGHDYAGTGQSLLRLTNRHCLACDREKFHERKQAKRQRTRKAAPVP